MFTGTLPWPFFPPTRRMSEDFEAIDRRQDLNWEEKRQMRAMVDAWHRMWTSRRLDVERAERRRSAEEERRRREEEERERKREAEARRLADEERNRPAGPGALEMGLRATMGLLRGLAGLKPQLTPSEAELVRRIARWAERR